MADILIVDDDASVVDAFTRFLRVEGHRARVASSGEDALEQIAVAVPDLVLMDVRMPGLDGLQTLERMRQQVPDLYVVIMTAFGTSQTSIGAIRAGAFDYLTKPLDLDQLQSVIAKALAARRVRQSLAVRSEIDPAPAGLVGESPQMLEVYKLIGRLASNDVPALVVGERGTGKDLVVATVHENSPRHDQPLTVVDCAPDMPQSAIETILASTSGTLHLRDIEGMPLAAQGRVVRLLTTPAMRGADTGPGARILGSTTVDLADRVRRGTFHPELWEALSVIVIVVPPLRERVRDISVLARVFAHRFSEQLGRPIAGLEDAATAALARHAWPGNVAELEQVVKRACVIASGDVVTASDVNDSLAQQVPSMVADGPDLATAVRQLLRERLASTSGVPSAFRDIVTLVEEILAREALEITRGNQVKAAELLGVNRATLRKKAGVGESPGGEVSGNRDTGAHPGPTPRSE